MDDLISRQSAIDAHCELCSDRGKCPDICPDVEVFRLITSTQPELAQDLHSACADAISRQAAIDAIFSEPIYKSGMKKRYADAVVPAIYEKIKSLPSAQPETIRPVRKMNDLISRLSEIRSNYNCFDENEEPYYRALSEAIQLASAQPEERTETPACDLILQTLKDAQPEWLPPADTDLSAYSDKLWKAAYERGKREAESERKRGKWIPMTRRYFINPDSLPYMTSKWIEATGSDEVEALKCSKCGAVYDFTEARNWCSECGADMRGREDE